MRHGSSTMIANPSPLGAVRVEQCRALIGSSGVGLARSVCITRRRIVVIVVPVGDDVLVVAIVVEEA